MLSPLGQRFVYSAKKLKNKVLTLPALIRELNARKRDFEELIARAKSFTSLLSVSSGGMSGVQEFDVSGIDNSERISGPSRIRSSKTDLATTVIQNFHTPNRQEIYKNSKLADDIEAALDSINDLIARLKEFPKDERTTAELKHLNAYKSELRDSMNNIVDVIGEFYDKHVPELYEDVLDHALDQLNSMIPGDSYKSMYPVDQTITSHDTFAGKKDAAIEFTTFIEIDGLNPEAFKTSKLFIALTGVVHESQSAAIPRPLEDSSGMATTLKKTLNASNRSPELLDLVRKRSVAVIKNQPRVTERLVDSIKKILTTTDPKYAKLVERLRKAEETGKPTETIEKAIDKFLIQLYESVVLRDADVSVSGKTNVSGVLATDVAYQNLLTKRDSAIRKRAKKEVIEAFDRKVAEYLEKKYSERVDRREKRAKVAKTTSTVYHMAFYVTALTKVRGPGMFDPGTELGGNNVAAIKRSLTKELRMLLAMHTSAPIIGKLPIDKTTQELRHSPLGNVPGIRNITVKDDVITITTSTSKEDVVTKTIIPDVLLALNSMFRTNKQTRFYISQELKGTGSGIILKATYVKS